eukprot:TRINITY_DN42749_c2_g2_i3.p1 TRINITY_DN42749_c2_g2~~TRINITY_DN42749_c2_g2_i3.p1  ORF type:complete len:306 (-),score=27.95 TRINITY_DN42749_c2_g2_i3:312-1229(-)
MILVVLASLLVSIYAQFVVDPECEQYFEIPDYPHIVSVDILNGQDLGIQWHACSGIMITNNLVLATASCIEALRYDQTVNGTLYTNVEVSVSPYCRHSIGREQITVDSYYFHPLYRNPDVIYNNDIAILALDREFQNVTDVEIFYEFMSKDERNLTVNEGMNVQMVSYGQKNESDQVTNFTSEYYSQILKHDMDVIRIDNMDICRSWFKARSVDAESLPDSYFEGFLCGYALKGDLCVGDYGTPAIVQDEQGAKVILGLLSWMPFKRCNSGDVVPLMFTNVGHYADWIFSMIDEYETYGGFLWKG